MSFHPAPLPPVGLGVTSLTLGATGLLLFFLPILGIPIALAGLAVGAVGLALAIRGRRPDLHRSIAGVVVCLVVLGANLAIAFAPAGYVPSRPARPRWPSVPDRPYVAPPANPGWDLARGASK